MAISTFGALHGLVNCAGVACRGEKCLARKVRIARKSFTKVININLVGTFNMIRLAA
ncbi:MAG: SDR family oxidoreductase [Betaproteobacteria bacterium]|nr:SDR family oxidoreductase [Betaproteobacteria bacterium]